MIELLSTNPANGRHIKQRGRHRISGSHHNATNNELFEVIGRHAGEYDPSIDTIPSNGGGRHSKSGNGHQTLESAGTEIISFDIQEHASSPETSNGSGPAHKKQTDKYRSGTKSMLVGAVWGAAAGNILANIESKYPETTELIDKTAEVSKFAGVTATGVFAGALIGGFYYEAKRAFGPRSNPPNPEPQQPEGYQQQSQPGPFGFNWA